MPHRKAKITPHGCQVTAVRMVSVIASLTRDTGREDPPHIADRLPVPRESQSHTRMYLMLSAPAPQTKQGPAPWSLNYYQDLPVGVSLSRSHVSEKHFPV